MTPEVKSVPVQVWIRGQLYRGNGSLMTLEPLHRNRHERRKAKKRTRGKKC